MTLTEELRFDTTTTEDAAARAAEIDPSTLFGDMPEPGSPFFDDSPGDDPYGVGSKSLDATFNTLLASIKALPASRAIATIGRYSRMLTASEAELIAAHQRSGATPRETEELIGQGGKRSKKDKKQRAKRGETLKNNPDLKDDVETGAVSEEQLDDLANADAKTDGAASRDPELLDEVRNSNPDQSKESIRDFVNTHNKSDEETEHDRQRRLRKVSRFTNKDGVDAILAEGDKATIDAIWGLILKDADDLYRKDGGRDVPASKHRRTHAQRLFDAFANRLTGNGGRGSSGRPSIVVTARLGDDGELVDPHLIGSGPLPRSVFDRYFCNATIAGILFGRDGEALWHGRKYRTATAAQHTTLAVRDGGCVLCRAHPKRCEAHHLMPSSAPGKGLTDIDNLALLCPDCHHLVHDTNKTLYQDSAGRWKLRPATPNETAPKRRTTGEDRGRRRSGRSETDSRKRAAPPNPNLRRRSNE